MSLTTLFPFDPKEFSLLIGELPGGLQEAYAMVICAFEDIRKSGLELSFFLGEDLSGTELPLPHSVLSSTRHSREGEEKSRPALLTRILRIEGDGQGNDDGIRGRVRSKTEHPLKGVMSPRRIGRTRSEP